MNEVSVVKENNTQIANVEDYKKIAVEWLTSTGNLQKFTENEKMQFCDICQAYGLNPIKKEVYGIKYGNNFNLIVGYESYIKRAERSGRLDGWHVEVLGSGADMKAVITINRKDWNKPFIHEVYFEEYNTNQNLWKTKPRTMLKKVAIAQGFRMCFSEELGGMPYTADELPEVQSIETSETTPLVKDVTPTLSDKPQKNNTKKYTKEEADRLAGLMNQVRPDGSAMFSTEEKNKYRKMLMNGNFGEAFEEANKIVQEKIAAVVEGELVTEEEQTPLF